MGLDEESEELILQKANGDVVEVGDILLDYGVTYRFTVKSEVEVAVYGSDDFEEAMSLEGNECGCASMGPLMVTLDAEVGESIYLRSATGAFVQLRTVHQADPSPQNTSSGSR